MAMPLWAEPPRANYDALLKDLEASRVPCTVCAVADERAAKICAVGDAFGAALRSRLEEAGLDGFGECGELHTLAEVWHVEAATALGVAV